MTMTLCSPIWNPSQLTNRPDNGNTLYTELRPRPGGIAALAANTARIVPETRVADYMPFLDAAARLGARHVMASLTLLGSQPGSDEVGGLPGVAEHGDGPIA